MDKFKAMEAFVKVVDTGGFTRASDVMGTPKATLSTHVQELEAELGVRLLHRTTRKVTGTADGAALFRRRSKRRRALNGPSTRLTAPPGFD